MIYGKNIVIIGGTGSLGKELIKKFYKNNEIIVISRDELKHWKLKLIYGDNIKYIIGDIRDKDRLENIFNNIKIDILIIASAMKHIDVCENNITECLKTNIDGVKNIIDIVQKLEKIEKVLYISTDKACSPTSIYGMSKAIAERLICDVSKYSKKTKFFCVRCGNILNSNGSLIHKLYSICKTDKNLTVTDEKMTRFFMTFDESIKLIIDTLNYGLNGQIWIPCIYSFSIYELIELFSKKYEKKINVIGIRNIEKIHELLIDTYEINKCIKIQINDNKYYIIQYHNNIDTQEISYHKIDFDIVKNYSSKNISDISILKNIIINNLEIDL